MNTISNVDIRSVKKYIHITINPPLHISGMPIKNKLAEQAKAAMEDTTVKPL
jgi:16S rRNA G1207 methylase RsmC